MPKVPQRQVLSAGSSGVQADSDLESAGYRSIGRLGEGLVGLSDQKVEAARRLQRHIDSGSAAAYARDNSVYSQDLNSKLEDPTIRNNTEAQNKLFHSQSVERRNALAKQFSRDGVSESAKREILADFDALTEKQQIALSAKQTKDKIDLHNFNKISAAEYEMFAGRVEDANGIIDSAEMSDLQKAQVSKSLFDRFLSKSEDNYNTSIRFATNTDDIDYIKQAIKEDKWIREEQKAELTFKADKQKVMLVSAAEKIWLDEQKAAINTSDRVDVIEGIKPLEGISQKAINTFEQAKKTRIKTIKLNTANEKIELINKFRHNDLFIEDLANSNLDQNETALFSGLLISGSDGFNRESKEFSVLANEIKTWAFSGPLNAEPDVTEKDEIWKKINSGSYNMNAQTLLGALMIEAETLDASNGEIDVADQWTDLKLDDDGKKAYASVSNMMLARMGATKGLPMSESDPLFKGRKLDGFGVESFKAKIDPDVAFDTWKSIRGLAEQYLQKKSPNIDLFMQEAQEQIDNGISKSELNKMFLMRQEAVRTKALK